MLPRNLRQEAMSRAYVQAVAARAGLITTVPGADFGIDLCLHTVELRGRRCGPGAVQLDLQLKSTTRAQVRGEHLYYDLDVKNYDDLRAPAPLCPRLLTVLVLPELEDEWLNQTAEELILRRCAYWLWLGGAGPTTATTTVRVQIPLDHVFSVAAVQAIVARLERGEPPC
jgi:Domain of unknown function (DUF4365)